MTTPSSSPQPSGGDAVAASGQPSGRPFTVAALILAFMSLAMMPPAGIVGVVCGSIGWSRGDRTLGIASVVLSVIGFIGGFILAALLLDDVVSWVQSAAEAARSSS